MPDENYPFPTMEPSEEEISQYIRETSLRYALAFTEGRKEHDATSTVAAAKIFADYMKGEVNG